MTATRSEQRLHVIDQRGTGQHAADGIADLKNLRGVQARLKMGDHFASIGGREQRALGLAFRIIQTDAQHEAIELRIRKRIRSSQVDGILRGDDKERRRQRMRHAIGGHLLFGHRFEQRTLRFRRRAVDLVGEHELCEQRSGMEFEFAALALVHADPDNVGRQQIGRELDALERKIERRGKGVRQRSLADAGQIFDQKMAACKDARERKEHPFVLSEHDLVDLLLRTRQRGGEAGIERQGFGNGREAGLGHDREVWVSPSISNVTMDASRPPDASATRRRRTAFWTLWTLVLAAKFILAARLAPFGDEAWYWQESRSLDWAFSDLPPATALLIRLGETLLGHGVLAMRAPFVLLGALIPILLMRTGTRIFGTAAGYTAGLLALALPLLATLGIFALPDVPLTVCSVLALDSMERAARDGTRQSWIELGLALAGAWLSHYRAAMLLLAGLAFLCCTPRGRQLWRSDGLWIALIISLIGLIPLLVFNAQHDWVGFGFQLVDRHPWSFHADALIQPVEQAIVCTPLFYGFMLWAAWICFRHAPDGAPWDLFAASALVPLLGYFVIGCFADDTRFRIHWPLPGYLPLLVAMPVMIVSTTSRRFFIAASGVLVMGSIVAFAYLAMAAIPGGAIALTRVKAFPEHFVGWREVAHQTDELLAQPQFTDAVLVADNFMLAAELDFALGGTRPVYSLDHPINTKHGRTPQLALWQRDEAGLRTLGNRKVLLVSEPTARRERERDAWMKTLCSRVDDSSQIAELQLYGGRKRYLFFSGSIRTDRNATTACDR
jgi:Dolichyl-phosphate-mannose-protein mannosyltransferase